MGMLIDGTWQSQADRRFANGAFEREPSALTQWPLPRLRERLSDASRPVWLVASPSCPWSHRCVLVRTVKRLDEQVPLAFAGGPRVEGYALRHGVELYPPTRPRHVHELYALTDRDYTGRATVPLLFDREHARILSNDSSHILRVLDALTSAPGFTLVPASLRTQIDALNEAVDRRLANGVYRAGLAQRQSAYDEAIADVFGMLEELDARLARQRYLLGAVVTEADWRLFATLCRFDPVYATHFRCTRKRLVDHAHLWAYARDLAQWPGVAATIDVAAILEGYYLNDGTHNPHRIVAEAPRVDWSAPHARERLGPTLVHVPELGDMPLAALAELIERGRHERRTTS